jgi:hypothetical protein
MGEVRTACPASFLLKMDPTPATPRHFNPVITRASASSETATAGQVLTFEVDAVDSGGSALTFSWAANTGMLGTPAHGASSSRMTWTAPSCARASRPPTITVTVTNAFNLTVARSFWVVGLPSCDWTSTGSMASPREGHTATPLPDGKVLVSGGSSGGYLATAEVYDSATGTWSATGSMTWLRSSHTATPLPDGKVLVAGGYSGGPLATTEVYDPATGTWSVVGSMASSRYDHTATTLPDGKVLVSGGYSGYSGGPRATAEVYDPARGTWSTAGSMASSRYGHTATLLPDGKVLVSGGFGGGYLATAEVYDPATGVWSATGSMASPRLEHTATLLPDGRVLVSGGRTNTHGDVLATAEVYDPASGTWSAVRSMASPHYGHTATLLLNGKVLVSGGRESSYYSNSFRATEVYDPASEIWSWSTAGSMTSPREGHTATLLPNGQVLVSGGYYWNGSLATVELYTPL